MVTFLDLAMALPDTTFSAGDRAMGPIRTGSVWSIYAGLPAVLKRGNGAMSVIMDLEHLVCFMH